MKVNYIYALIDPRDGGIWYVGKSANPKGRLDGHWWDHCEQQRFHNSRKVKWILSLKSVGARPQIAILEECTEADWVEHEQFWIKYFRSAGEPLTNGNDGGGGCGNGHHLSAETRRRIGEANKGKSENKRGPKSEAHRRSIANAKRLWWAALSTEERSSLMRSRGLFGSDRWQRMPAETRDRRRQENRAWVAEHRDPATGRLCQRQ